MMADPPVYAGADHDTCAVFVFAIREIESPTGASAATYEPVATVEPAPTAPNEPMAATRYQ